MILLIVCIACNVLLGVTFKLFDKYDIDTFGAIIINYFVATFMAVLILRDLPFPNDVFTISWFPYALGLGFTFIIGFNILGLTFQRFGISITTIVQKMSLILPVAFAISLYGEPITLMKSIGIILALIAIVLANFPDSKVDVNEGKTKIDFLFLASVFVMSGGIEIALFYVNAAGIVENGDMQFTSTTFLIAGILGLGYYLFSKFKNPVQIRQREIIAGLILGVPNFFTIYLLVLLLNKGWQGSVLFPTLNISILISATLVGILLFQEKLSLVKSIGLASALLAIILISMT